MRSSVGLTLGWFLLAAGCSDPERNNPGSSGSSSLGGASAAGGNAQSGAATLGGASPVGSGGASPGGVNNASGGSSAGANTAGGSSAGGSAQAGSPSGGSAQGGGAQGGAVAASGGSAQGGMVAMEDGSAELFAPTSLPRFDIDLPAASITALNAVTGSEDVKQNDYVHATLRYGTETVADIGLRIKGEGSFRKLDKKTAFKLKFDEYVPKQAFRGLRRLTLNNMVEDPSFLAERLAYDVFRAAGLPAPRCNSALVYVNNVFYGVYAHVEAEDKTFLSRWFTSNEGNLFEEGQSDFVAGAATAFDLETNETANDRTGLTALIAAVQAATAANFSETVGVNLNLPHFLRFTAAEAAVNQWDMYAYTVFYPNNFRIYQDPGNANRFVFLPWGMDMSMKPFRDSGRPHIPVFGIARQGDSTGGRITAGVIFRKCLESPACKASYTTQVRELADLYERAKLDTVAATYYAQIKTQVYADPRKEYTNERFEQGYQTLLTTIRERPTKLRDDLK